MSRYTSDFSFRPQHRYFFYFADFECACRLVRFLVLYDKISWSMKFFSSSRLYVVKVSIDNISQGLLMLSLASSISEFILACDEKTFYEPYPKVK